MGKIIDYIKKHKFFTYGIIIMTVVFILTLIQNFWTRYLADDWCYMYLYDHMGHPTDTSRRIKTIFDVIVSMKNHWKICNGRVVAHGLLQLVLSTSYPGFHKIIFNIVNSLMYVFLGGLIYKHAAYKRTDSLLLFMGIYAMMWFFIPQYGATVLWASGAANYLWCAVIILLYLMPYRMYAVNSENIMKDSIRNAVVMGVLGLFAGCTNENSGGALALMCILFTAYYKISKIKIPKWSLSGIVGTIIGAIVLLVAPGNYRISSKADFAELINRLKDVIGISKNLLFGLLIILCIVMFFVLITNNKYSINTDWKMPIIFIIGAAASIGVLIFAALRPERTWFIAICLMIIVIGYIFTAINLTTVKKLMPVVTIALIIVCIISYTVEFKKLYSTYTQIQVQDNEIYNALKNGDREVKVKLIVPSDSKHDSMFYTGNFSTNGDEWDNSWAAKYYGLNKIIGVEP